MHTTKKASIFYDHVFLFHIKIWYKRVFLNSKIYIILARAWKIKSENKNISETTRLALFRFSWYLPIPETQSTFRLSPFPGFLLVRMLDLIWSPDITTGELSISLVEVIILGIHDNFETFVQYDKFSFCSPYDKMFLCISLNDISAPLPSPHL